MDDMIDFENEPLSDGLQVQVSKARKLTELQMKIAEEIVTDMGVGGRHPQLEQITAVVMQTLATNLLATITYSQ